MATFVALDSSRVVTGNFPTQALATAWATANDGSTVHVGAITIPEGAFVEPGWSVTPAGVAQRAPVIINARAETKRLAEVFLGTVYRPYLRDEFPKRQRWLDEKRLTNAEIYKPNGEVVDNPNDDVKRLVMTDRWGHNIPLLVEDSLKGLRGMADADPAPAPEVVIAQSVKVIADIAYGLNEVKLGTTEIFEFWYAGAAIVFYNYLFGDAWVTGHVPASDSDAGNLGQPIARYRTIVPRTGWNLTTCMNQISVYAIGL